MRTARLGLWLTVIAVFAMLLGLGTIIVVSRPGVGGAGLADAVVTVFGVVLVIACVWWAVYLEHLLRTRIAGGGGPGIRYPAGRPTVGRHSAPRRRRPRPSHHRERPAFTAISGVITTLLGLGMAMSAVHAFDAWRLSAYVQTHGVEAAATVVSVRNVRQSARGGFVWYTAEVGVALHSPVDRTASTTVYDPTHSSASRGETVSVLVDPQRPSYAEFPGRPYGDLGSFVLWAVCAAVMLPPAGLLWWTLIVRIRQRRRTPGLPQHAQSSP